jgi:hypothetical protein
VTNPPELAFYYPGPTWRHTDLMKNMILFFDGIALLVPDYMVDRVERSDPSLVAGLREHDLLQILDPASLVDASATAALATQLGEIIETGHLDHLAAEPMPFAELSMSRMGWSGDSALAEALYAQLAERGLARATEDGVSIPMHPLVRNLILVLLSQILRGTALSRGVALSPVTDSPEVQGILSDTLGLAPMPSAGHVVALDLQVVGIDLAPIGIDEALDFREEHGKSYRDYTRDLRRVTRELSLLPIEERPEVLRDREAALRDTADGLRKTVGQQLGTAARGSGLALGLAGAAWAVAHGHDAIGGLLAGGTALGGASTRGEAPVATAYSYLFDARATFG